MGIGQHQLALEGRLQVIGEARRIALRWQPDGSVGRHEGVVVGRDIGAVGIGVAFLLPGEADRLVAQQHVAGLPFVEIEGGLQHRHVRRQGAGGEFLVDAQVVELGEVHRDVQGHAGKAALEGRLQPVHLVRRVAAGPEHHLAAFAPCAGVERSEPVGLAGNDQGRPRGFRP